MFARISTKAGYNLGRGLVAALQAISANFGLLEPSVRTSAAADYVPVVGDSKILRSNAAAQTLTIAPNATQAFDIGRELVIVQSGAGALTVVAGAGVTIRTPPGKTLVLSGQYAQAVLEKVGTNEWVISGDLTPVANTSTVATAGYVLAANDRVVRRTYGVGAQTTTVPPAVDVNFPLGTTIRVEQASAQINTIVAGAGVTVNVIATKTLATTGQFGMVSLTKIAADIWNASGDLAAAA